MIYSVILLKMEKMNNEEIIKNPEKYAAVYARVSNIKDNNSIKAQIEDAKEKIYKENLLFYAAYIDHISGRTTPPHEREGFGKLLEDAKAGKFKTIVAYRHDRLVRNLKDWIDLKNLLNKLGIRIIFSDEAEYVSDNTIQGEFLENLIVMIAELEPNNINERASRGRDFRRKQGVYNSAKNVPFGYIRDKYKGGAKNSNIKSHYCIDEFRAPFIEYIFAKYKLLIQSGHTEPKFLEKEIKNFFSKISDNLTQNKILTIENLSNDSYERKILHTIKKYYLKYYNLNTTKNFFEDIKSSISNTAKLQIILKNPIYACYILKDSVDASMGTIIENNIPKVNFEAFNRTINVERIIDDNTFEIVYPNIIYELMKKNEEDYLLKNKLYCDKCNCKLKLSQDYILTCSKGCYRFNKSNLIESILEIMIDDVLSKSSDGFHNFKRIIENKINDIDKEINKNRIYKINLVKDYLENKDITFYTNSLNTLYKNTNSLLQKVAELRKQLSRLENLQNLISNYYKSKSNLPYQEENIDLIKSILITYILSNQDFFNPILDSIIKSIRVRGFEDNGKFYSKFNIEYSYIYKGNRNISEGIN